VIPRWTSTTRYGRLRARSTAEPVARRAPEKPWRRRFLQVIIWTTLGRRAFLDLWRIGRDKAHCICNGALGVVREVYTHCHKTIGRGRAYWFDRLGPAVGVEMGIGRIAMLYLLQTSDRMRTSVVLSRHRFLDCGRTAYISSSTLVPHCDAAPKYVFRVAMKRACEYQIIGIAVNMGLYCHPSRPRPPPKSLKSLPCQAQIAMSSGSSRRAGSHCLASPTASPLRRLP